MTIRSKTIRSEAVNGVEHPVVGQAEGFDIRCVSGHFVCAIEDHTISKDRYAECAEAVMEYMKRKRRSDKAALSIQLVDKDLRSYTLTGIHAGSGMILTKPKVQDRFDVAVYFDSPRTRELLSTVGRLNAELAPLMEELDELECEKRPGGYHAPDPEGSLSAWAAKCESAVRNRKKGAA